MHKKIKDVPESSPEFCPEMTLFSPSRDPPGGPKKSHFSYFFLTFPHFPSISVEESLCKIRNREIHRNDVPWYVKPKKALFPTFSQESDNSDPGSRIQDLTQKILRRKNIQIPDLNNSLPKNLLGEKISLVRDQSNLEDPSWIIFRQLLTIFLQSASQNFTSSPDPRSRSDPQTLRSPTATQKKYIWDPTEISPLIFPPRTRKKRHFSSESRSPDDRHSSSDFPQEYSSSCHSPVILCPDGYTNLAYNKWALEG